MLKVIAFDFDGTVADSVDLILELFSRVLGEAMGSCAPSREEILAHFGMNEPGILRFYLGPERAKEAEKRYYALLPELHPLLSPAPFPGIRELLTELKSRGVRVTLLTGRCEKTAQLSLKFLGLASLFDICQYGSAEKSSKADQLKELTELAGCAPEELIYVGDTAGDFLSCREAGVRCLSAAWSPTAHRTELEKLNPGNVFPNIPLLRRKLLELTACHAER